MLQNIKKITDYNFFYKRYVGLLIDFPNELIPETFDKALCPRDLDVKTAITVLRSGHTFLQNVARALDEAAPTGQKAVFDVFLKIDLLWFLGIFGHVEQEDNGYYIRFDKKELTGQNKTVKTAPESFIQAFEEVKKCGCMISFYKNGEPIESYRNCDSGTVRFSDPMAARGIHLFVQTLISRPRPDFKYKKTFNPIVQCASEYYQTDMRLFLREECRPPFDVDEMLAALSPQAKERFHIMWDFVAEQYPQCLPIGYGLYDYIMSGAGFGIDNNHRMIGQLTIGFNPDQITFYSAMSPESVAEIIRKEVNFTGLAKASSCGDWMRVLTNEGAVNATKIMNIQAKHNKNAGICK